MSKKGAGLVKANSQETILNDPVQLQIRCTDEVQIEYERYPQAKPTQKRSFE